MQVCSWSIEDRYFRQKLTVMVGCYNKVSLTATPFGKEEQFSSIHDYYHSFFQIAEC
jgi:hypothetical protein